MKIFLLSFETWEIDKRVAKFEGDGGRGRHLSSCDLGWVVEKVACSQKVNNRDMHLERCIWVSFDKFDYSRETTLYSEDRERR